MLRHQHQSLEEKVDRLIATVDALAVKVQSLEREAPCSVEKGCPHGSTGWCYRHNRSFNSYGPRWFDPYPPRSRKDRPL